MDTLSDAQAAQSRKRLSTISLAAGAILLIITAFIGIADNPPGLTALIVGGFAILVGVFFRFTKSTKRTALQELLYWTPRALAITSTLFISIFALDAFGEGRGIWEALLGFLVHLIPTFVLVAVLVLSWRREWIGGILFVAFALAYSWMVWNSRLHWMAAVFIAGPLLLTGVLFLLNWRFRYLLRDSAPH